MTLGHDTGWRLDADSPLLAFLDGRPRRAPFTVHPGPATDRPYVEGLFAGAAEADITPPPGLPKAGYSSNAHLGNGFRTRLRARVTHLRAGPTSLALVQCDLLGGSAVLQHLVARAVAETTDVPLAGLFIGATHTHAGPGQFLGTDFYNKFASNKAGFDPAWTQFLVTQIAGAVQQAVDTRRPARLAFGRTEVWGLTRNRSLEPHTRNPSVTDRRLDPQRKFVAVNPWLHLLRLDAAATDGGLKPLAANIVFSVHGTGISMKSHEYNADVWAYLCDEASRRIETETGHRAVVGAMEGTHADVAPAIRPHSAGHLEAARIGRGIGAIAARLHARLGGELSEKVTLGCGLREIDLDSSRKIDGIEIPRRPAVGASLVAGAHENLTPVINHVGPFRAGHPKRRLHPDQGGKWVLGSRLGQRLVLPLKSMPRVLPVQVLRIGDVEVVGLPFELTVDTGRRIESAVGAAVAGTGVDHVVVSSVANEYSGYVTTPEEYARQHYEGGHTLYGPRTQPFLTAHAAHLAGAVARSSLVSEVVARRSFDLKVQRFLPAPGGAPRPRAPIGRPRFVDPSPTTDGAWELCWYDVAPGDLDWHQPMVRVEQSDRPDQWEPARRRGRPVDDQGTDLQVSHLGHDDAGHRYAARWWDPLFHGQRRHRFVLEANGPQPEWASAPFD